MNKRILNIAIPNIISNITIPLLGIVDLALVGHLDSEAYIGAIALGSMLFNFIYWGFSFLRMGEPVVLQHNRMVKRILVKVFTFFIEHFLLDL